MKHSLLLVCLLLTGIHLNSQSVCNPPIYSLNSMTVVSGSGGVGSVYRFNSTLSGVNTFVTITKLQNATITNSNMDVTGSFALAWQPTIRFTSSRVSGDSSYIEFSFKFVDVGSGANLNSINNGSAKQDCMAMTIVDCDGPGSANSYREMVKVSLPATPVGILNSTINVTQDDKWIKLISGSAQFSNIDTTDYAAMAQINFPQATSNFTLRVGAAGAVTANLDRQFSFYFKSFTGLNFVLPVNLISFNALLKDQQVTELKWATASEQGSDRFEIYRSLNGKDFQSIGSVNAAGNSNDLKNYSYTDYQISGLNAPAAYYKLKMVETDGSFHWSGILKTQFTNSVSATGLISVSPNPAGNLIHVGLADFASASEMDMEIVDIYGKSIYSAHNPETVNGQFLDMDISFLIKGMYFIRLTNSNGGDVATVKFVKQ